MEIGTKIGQALALVSLDDAAVSAWLGRDCRCAERRQRLDALGHWAARVLAGKLGDARHWLRLIVEGREQ